MHQILCYHFNYEMNILTSHYSTNGSRQQYIVGYLCGQTSVILQQIENYATSVLNPT